MKPLLIKFFACLVLAVFVSHLAELLIFNAAANSAAQSLQTKAPAPENTRQHRVQFGLSFYVHPHLDKTPAEGLACPFNHDFLSTKASPLPDELCAGAALFADEMLFPAMSFEAQALMYIPSVFHPPRPC